MISTHNSDMIWQVKQKKTHPWRRTLQIEIDYFKSVSGPFLERYNQLKVKIHLVPFTGRKLCFWRQAHFFWAAFSMTMVLCSYLIFC